MAPYTSDRNKSTLILAGSLCVVLAAFSLAGWAVPQVQSWPPRLLWLPTALNSGAGLALAGIGLWAMAYGRTVVAFLAGVPLGVVSVATLLEYVGHRSLGIDNWLKHDGLTVPYPEAGRMAALSAVLLLLAALSLLTAPLLQRHRHARREALVAALGGLLIALSVAGLIGQLAPVWPVWTSLTSIGLQPPLGYLGVGVALYRLGREQLYRHRLGAPFLALIVFITIAGILAHAVGTYERGALRADIRYRAQAIGRQIAAQDGALGTFKRTATVWGRFGAPTGAVRRLDTNQLLRQVPGLLALAWAGPSGRARWSVTRPGDPRTVASGLVLPAPLAARALRSDQGAVSLLHHTGGSRAYFLVAVAARRPDTTQARGYLLAVFDATRWLSGLAASGAGAGYAIAVHLEGHLLYATGGPGVTGLRGHMRVPFFDRALDLTVQPQAATRDTFENGLSTVVLATGVMLALLAATVVYLLGQARNYAARLAAANQNLEEAVKARTRALQEERERWRVTLLSIGDGVIITDAEGRVTAINAEAEVLTGWSGTEALGQPVTAVFALRDDQAGTPRDPVSEVLKSGRVQPVRNSVELCRRDGYVRQVSDTCAPIRTASGQLIGCVVVFRDMTLSNVLEEEVAKTRGLEALGLVASGVAHDFNNILTSIVGAFELAQLHAGSNQELVSILDSGRDAAWHARTLVHQLTTFARSGSPAVKSASIAQVITQLCDFFLRSTPISCSTELADDLWPAALDITQVTQVLQNLLINAIQAMPDGGQVRITAHNRTLAAQNAEAVSQGDYVVVTLSDTGTGIEAQHLDKIFDPYFSLKPEGTGLGLAIVRSIVVRHGGDIRVTSIPRTGTHFTIYLPRSFVSPQDLVETEAQTKATPGSCTRVLLMDDDAAARGVGAAMLRSLGYCVHEAASGEEALRDYQGASDRGEPYEALMLDLVVQGGMGATGCAQALRRINPDAKLIVISGYPEDPVMARFREYGFVACLAKPFLLKELKDVMTTTLLGASRSRRDAGI